MKEAIGVYNGWKCPTCKKLVQCPTWLKHADQGEEQGLCTFCGEHLHFTKVKFVKEEAKKFEQLMKDTEKDYGRMNEEDELDKVREQVRKDMEYDPYKRIFNLDELEDIEERPVMVNFLNKPLLLKWLKKMAIDKDLFLSEVVVSFVAFGAKHYIKGLKRLEKAINDAKE